MSKQTCPKCGAEVVGGIGNACSFDCGTKICVDGTVIRIGDKCYEAQLSAVTAENAELKRRAEVAERALELSSLLAYPYSTTEWQNAFNLVWISPRINAAICYALAEAEVEDE